MKTLALTACLTAALVDAPVWEDPDTGLPRDVLEFGTFEYRTFHSARVSSNVSYIVYLPPGYAGGTKRYPVLYSLHGGGGDERTNGFMAALADSAMQRGLCPEFIIVLVRGLTSVYVDSNYPAAPYDVPMETVIIQELLPHVDLTYRTIGTREMRAIEGFSMGGYGAAHLGFKYPDLFGAVSDFAGALVIPLPGEAWEGAFGGDMDYFMSQHPTTIVAQNADRIRGRTHVRIVVGDEDTGRGTLPANVDFHDQLASLGIEHEFILVPGVAHAYRNLYSVEGDGLFDFYRRAFAAAPPPPAGSSSSSRCGLTGLEVVVVLAVLGIRRLAT